MHKLKSNLKAFILETLQIIVTAAIAFFVVNTFLGQVLIITGSSMVPTFANGEQIFSEKLSIRFSEVHRGEIIVFRHPEARNKLIIKRLVGMPGDTIRISAGKVYINDIELLEKYVKESETTSGGDFLQEGQTTAIPPEKYIVLGDNRSDSYDSRQWGFVTKENIIGRPAFVYYPLKSIRIIKP